MPAHRRSVAPTTATTTLVPVAADTTTPLTPTAPPAADPAPDVPAQLADQATRTLPSERGTSARRLVGVDAARGVALLGMMAVHALLAVGPDGSPSLPWLIAEGRAAALFAVLAGVGIAFMTGRRRWRAERAVAGPVASLVTRGLAVGALGLALGYTDPSIAAVILPYYALLFVLAVPLLFSSTRTLLLTGTALAVVMPVLSHLVRPSLPPPALENPSFASLVSDPLGLLSELSLTGYYPALPWMAYVAVGLGVGRMRLSSPRTSAALLGVGAAVALGASLLSGLLLAAGGRAAIVADAAGAGTGPGRLQEVLAFGSNGTTPPTTWWWLVVDVPHSTTPPDLLHTLGVSIGVLGLTLLLGHVTAPVLRWPLALVREPLAAAGGMTLTFYTAHVMFMNSPLDTYAPTTGYVLQVIAVLLIGLGWRATAGRGPLEAAVTGLTRRASSWASPR